ncbi:ECF RNA polymerase sigma factor RpoE [Aquisphaera giovannonii]|uniref:ECF RNA polymerase sigma factor RpoE n=1 Tax=Aquisphaera giovannonii TaxID=406548 RepID=A0A5B9VUY4_9BACT|nr:sigma-70 family RNA polymerase sigma factor [Aquisphaera giovannonii]QEH31919.1 ECF RNA polymerase sigma factor RpoE [Aquisphaera giovannonii]
MARTLLQRIAGGDQSAVPECLARYGGLVWSLAIRSCGGDRAEAEDATQEIFLDLWTHCGRFDPGRGGEETFVALIARRRLTDRMRRASRRPTAQELPADLAGPWRPDEVEVRDEVGRVMRALAGMPDDKRRVLILAIHLGMTHEEIARETGMPLGTVKTHARRGLAALRTLLAAEEGEPSRAGEPSKGGGS